MLRTSNRATLDAPAKTWRVALFHVLALIVLLPRPVKSAEPTPPAVDLDQISWSSDGASAALVGGGRAQLTLQRELQQSAERLLARAHSSSGAVVAIEARTGRVLVWTEQKPHASGRSSLLQAVAPAASVFKIVTSAALLERSHVSPAQEVCISGGMRSIERRHLDPPRTAVSCSRFGLALGHSRNAVYAQLVTRYLARADLADVASRFGFNANVPFDADVPVGTLEIPYNDLEFARAATGFRGSKLSVLGAAYLGYVIANGGRAARVRIVQSSDSYEASGQKQLLHKVIEPETARVLTRMLEVTVHSGTSLDAFRDESGRAYLPGMRVAAKTGTLQSSAHAPTSSWFVGFAPSRDPQIIVSVLLSNGPVWRSKAKDIGRDVLRAYFAGRGYGKITDPLASNASP